MPLDLRVVEDYEALSTTCADLLFQAIAENPSARLVLATGSTPMGAYRRLMERVREERLDTSRLRVFQLDEYVGLGPEDRRSLYGWMLRSFVQPLGVPESQVVRLPGDVPDADVACREYERAVRDAGGYDLAVLGLGPNGHLGFNEPPAEPTSPTRVVELTEESLESNAVYWGGRDEVPPRAITVGMDLLLGSRRVLLVVSGEHKRAILRRTVQERSTPDVPASHLQLVPDTTVIADMAAWEGDG